MGEMTKLVNLSKGPPWLPRQQDIEPANALQLKRTGGPTGRTQRLRLMSLMPRTWLLGHSQEGQPELPAPAPTGIPECCPTGEGGISVQVASGSA